MKRAISTSSWRARFPCVTVSSREAPQFGVFMQIRAPLVRRLPSASDLRREGGSPACPARAGLFLYLTEVEGGETPACPAHAGHSSPSEWRVARAADERRPMDRTPLLD